MFCLHILFFMWKRLALNGCKVFVIVLYIYISVFAIINKYLFQIK